MYAQAPLSVSNNIALSWFDYFCGFQILDMLEQILFQIRDAIRSLMAFFPGDETVFNTVPYIEDAMFLAGIDPSVYRNPRTRTTMVTYTEITIAIENSLSDVLSADQLKDFKKKYDCDTNFIISLILDILRRATANLSVNTGLGTISAPIDPFDDTLFFDTLTQLFSTTVSDAESMMSEVVSESLLDIPVTDSFYGAIADDIAAYSDNFVLSVSLVVSLTSAFNTAIP